MKKKSWNKGLRKVKFSNKKNDWGWVSKDLLKNMPLVKAINKLTK